MSKILMLCGALAWVSQAYAAATLTTNPTAVTFTYQIGATKLPSAQTISVKVSTGSPTFTATTPGIDPWLTVDPGSGSVPVTLNVRVNPTSLPAATYTSAITLTVTGGLPVTTIPVTLIVSPPAPTLTVSTASLVYSMTPISTSTQTVAMSTDGEPISYVATAGATWITVNPAVGVVLPGPATTLSVTVDTTTLAPQIAPYTGKVSLVLTGASVKSLNLTVNVTVNSAGPTITSIWPNILPLNGAAQTVTITGTNFYSASLAEVQGVALPLVTTVYKDSSTIMQAVIPANLLTVSTTLQILVSNPAPGGNSGTLPVVVGNTPTILGILNAASFVSGPVSPGEIITIFGSNIGPAIPAQLSIINGFATTTLSNVSVTVDGQSAAMVYVSTNQISIQVPYEVTIGANKAIVITNNGSTASSTVTTAATAPGIFTSNGSGTGQAAALNYDSTTKLYTLNSATNLATIGSVVVLYLTGEGDYNTPPLSGAASDDGYIVPLTLSPLPQVSPAPTVTIGGVAADVTNAAFFAGPIPGSMLGLLQINAVVPTGATTGVAVPVTVTIGANTSPAGVTLAIHP